jgi:ribose-phosphate pyrophosphokinase
MNDLKIFSGPANIPLTQDICRYLNLPMGKISMGRFPDGEISCKIDEDVRGRDVFIVQPTCPPVNDHLMELLVMIDSFKRASAFRLTAVIPYFGYARQDRKDSGRVPITAKLVANLITRAGADRVLAVDLHSGQIQGFFNVPVDHLTAAPVLEEYLKAHTKTQDLVVVAPDAGRVKVAERYAQHLGCDLALVHKTRPRGTANVAVARDVVGDVAGRHCILIDDMIDTAGTILAAAELLKAQGAGDIWVMATHAVFSPPAIERLMAAPVSRVVVTDTLPLPEERRFPKLEVLSVAPLVARAMMAVFSDDSVSEIFGGENLA